MKVLNLYLFSVSLKKDFEGSAPSGDGTQEKTGEQPADQTALAKLLTNPDTADLLKQLMTAMGK